MKPINELKGELKELVPRGNDIAIKGIKQHLPSTSIKYNEVIELEARFRDNHSKLLKRVIDDEVANLESNRIRAAILLFIDSLEANDFVAQNKGTNKSSKYKSGKILYRIPNFMQVDVASNCLIRIAFDEETLTYDLTIKQGDEIKEIKRISEVMSVELLDPSDHHPFKIKTFSEQVQFVDDDDYTEWTFFVTPLMTGEFSLLLKVSVIEIKLGKERKRDIVLEEHVQIISDKPVQSEGGAFKVFEGTINRVGNDLVSSNPVGAEPSTNVLKSGVRKFTKGIATVLILLIGASVGWAIPAVKKEIRWINTAYIENDKSAFETYRKQYPESHRIKFIEEKIDNFEWEEISNASGELKIKELKDYQQKYNDQSGHHYEKVIKELMNLEKDSRSQISTEKEETVYYSTGQLLQKEYEALIKKGSRFYKQKKYAEALKVYQIAKEKIKDNSAALIGIKNCKEQIQLAKNEMTLANVEEIKSNNDNESSSTQKGNMRITDSESKDQVIKEVGLDKALDSVKLKPEHNEVINEEPKEELNEIKEPTQFKDTRDDQVYSFKMMKDGNIWMNQNLNFDIPGSYCMDDNELNCSISGRLYTWEAAQKACPSGWRLPSDEEWSKLRSIYGGSNKAYRFLKARKNGFYLSFGGNRTPDGAYDGLRNLGYYWSRTEKNAEEGWICHFSKLYANIRRYEYDKNWAFSCRCIKEK